MTNCTSIDLNIPEYCMQPLFIPEYCNLCLSPNTATFFVVWSTPQFKVQVWTWRRPGNEAMANPYSCVCNCIASVQQITCN